MREYLAKIDTLPATRCGGSTSSVAIGTGAKTFTTQTAKEFALGEAITVSYAQDEDYAYMSGTVTAYNSGTGSISVNVTSAVGSGTYADWYLRQPLSLYYSTAGYNSRPGDIPSSQHFEARLKSGGSVTRRLWPKGATRGPAQIGNVKLELSNGDNGLDDGITYALDGQPIMLLRGESGEAYSTFDDIGNPAARWFRGYSEQAVYEDADKSRTVTLAARDLLHKLDIPLQPRKYGGTNVLPAGVDGTAELKGKPLPVAFGILFNITPVCVNTSKLIYQLHYTAFNTGYTIAVYDRRGTAWTAGADYANQADMEATAPAAGQYRVWPAGGMIRLGSTPELLTVDLTNPTDGGGSLGVLAVAAALMRVAGIDLSLSASLAAYPSVGIYVNEEVNLLAAMDRVTGSVNAVVYGKRSAGTVELAQLRAPGAVATLAITESPVLSIKRISPVDPGNGIPACRINVRYRRNWTPMSTGDVAGATMADAASVAQEYRVATWSGPDVKRQWRLAPELNIDTLINAEADAQAEADRLATLHGVQRDMLEVKVDLDDDTLVVDVNQVVHLTHSAFNLSGGKYFLVLDCDVDTALETVTYTIWG